MILPKEEINVVMMDTRSITIPVALVLICQLSRAETPKVTDTPRPERLSFEEEDALQAGLIGRFEQGPTQDARHFRMAAVHVASGATATPWLKAGGFSLTLEGYLFLELRDEFNFSIDGRGSATLELNGTPIYPASGVDLAEASEVRVRLHQGHNHIRVRYSNPANGDAWFRLMWEGSQFPREPVPPSALLHNTSDERLAAATQLRQGRTPLRGTQLPAMPSARRGSEQTMPEIAKDNPNLQEVALRLNEPWLFHWILNPSSLRNHVTMPDVIPGDEATRRATAADMVAYLKSLAAQSATPKTNQEPAADQIGAGEILFENLGCVACHHLQPPNSEDYFERTSLHFVGNKFRQASLREYLMNPRAHYRWSRMPDFRLADDEATVLAAYLRANSKGQCESVDELPMANPARGREHFQRLGCVNCHTIDEVKERAKTTSIAQASGGCLSDNDATRGLAPRFALDEEDRLALVAFLTRGTESLDQAVPAEASSRFVARLRCTSCHPRDDEGALWPEVLAEEGVQGLPPETVPPLTWTGEKLKIDWTEKQISGTLPYKARPWLKSRMPSFPARAANLAHGLAAAHGYGVAGPPSPPLDSEKAKLGYQMTQQNGGFYCIECHAVGDAAAKGAFSHHGVNFVRVGERLHYPYYRRWITDPLRVDSNSKMPKFSPDGKTTDKTQFYDGDAQKQFDALWHYLMSLAPGSRP